MGVVSEARSVLGDQDFGGLDEGSHLVARLEPQLLRRITGRRTCPKCNRIYNIYFSPPRRDELCDEDATPLVQRGDDTEEAFHKRMEEYRAKTLPVIPHYRSAGRFRTVNGDAPVETVAASVLCALKDLRRVPSDCKASETGVR